MTILRLLYKKHGVMKFISHLDMVRLTERTFRRAKLPLRFSNGFNPHPKISFGAPLSVGVTSDYEVLDVELIEEIDINEFLANQEKFVPAGITFFEGKYIDKSKALMSMLSDATFMLRTNVTSISLEELRVKLDEFLALDEIMIEKATKKKIIKQVNIKPLIGNFAIVSADDNEIISNVTVVSGSSGNLKPDVLLNTFYKFLDVEYETHFTRIHRTMLFGRENGRKVPLFDMK
ncbi:MAG: TIGR03936 family radical SAM-associated protein [Acidaminobacteraceae bacterium]